MAAFIDSITLCMHVSVWVGLGVIVWECVSVSVYV